MFLFSQVRASMNGSEANRLTDKELLAQMTVCSAHHFVPFRAPVTVSYSFNFFKLQNVAHAGHETSSTAMLWTLWTLAKFPDVQQKVREEFQNARAVEGCQPEDTLTFETLNELSYLDAVCVCDSVIFRDQPITDSTILHREKC